MEISFRDFITVLHGMGFGALFMLAFSGAIGVVYAAAVMGEGWPAEAERMRLFRAYLVSMAVLAWLTVLSGAFIVYPWYRAHPPVGANLADYPRALLLSSPHTAGWHEIGMEWKEHVAWLAPIATTMAAYLFHRYGPQLGRQRALRNAVLGFVAVAFVATGVAGLFGAMLNKFAPIRGGPAIVLLQEK
ncbi:hypothetical protein [Phenylobacterium montanum]|uniref:Uncharacterized protein n=1 Tax=Phenylobacterium montanum TaxID=2823693 RepID=A0A975G2W4_9CAUL|nr:hypothetical protein [Caulobacter sp. S6]QUD89706.1 hypothetical protein KCG34_07500 [Caulobacter sp. S6]